MATTSSYPGAIDSLQAPAATLAGTPTHTDIHLEIADAVENIETALGVNVANRLANAFASEAARDVAIPSPVAGNTAMTTYSGSVFFEWYDGTAWRSISLVSSDVSHLWFLNADGESVPLASTKSESRRTGAGGSFALTYTTAWPTGVTTVTVVAQVYRGGRSAGTPVVLSDVTADTSYVYLTVVESDGTACDGSDLWYCDFIATATY